PESEAVTEADRSGAVWLALVVEEAAVLLPLPELLLPEPQLPEERDWNQAATAAKNELRLPEPLVFEPLPLLPEVWA
ncbi:MAG: hypothetical protein KDM64_17285, partial [Verrucomicrobiae bacterium]|nr:hypothetical protein [Verrucomicrobiae bacterium]